MKHLTLSAALLAATLTTGCTTVGGPGSSTFYECSMGTRLQVDFINNAALVQINGARALAMRATPSTQGQVYEGAGGRRLAVNGGDVRWNTADRSAPETCRSIQVPR